MGIGCQAVESCRFTWLRRVDKRQVKAEETRCEGLRPEPGASKAVGLPDLRFGYSSSSVPNGSALAASDSLGAVQGEKKLIVYHTTTLPDTAAMRRVLRKSILCRGGKLSRHRRDKF